MQQKWFHDARSERLIDAAGHAGCAGLLYGERELPHNELGSALARTSLEVFKIFLEEHLSSRQSGRLAFGDSLKYILSTIVLYDYADLLSENKNMQ